MASGRALVACVVLVAGAIAGARAESETPAAEAGPRFDIRRFVFEGATRVPLERLQSATQPHAGPQRSFADVQRALEAIERLYAQFGYGATRVVLPEQEVEHGEVRFRIVEATLGRVIVEGNRFFSEASVRASLPALRPGEAPNLADLARNLRLANESPSRQATVVLRATESEATVDALVRVADEDPVKGSLTLDSSGTRKTGRLRTGFGLQHANAFGLDHIATLQFITAPYADADPQYDKTRWSLQPSKDVQIFGASYRIPLYRSGDSIDVNWAYSNVSTGQVAGFAITGVGGVGGVRYTKNLDRIGDYEHRWSASVDLRAYNNKGIRAAGTTTQVIPDITVHPLSLQYAGSLRGASGETAFAVGFSRNLPGGRDGGGAAFCESRSMTVSGSGHFECASAKFRIGRWSVSHGVALGGDWQGRLAMNGQFTRDMLVPGEQFGIGGVDSVRGFREREVTSDSGYRGSVEAWSPDFGRWASLESARARVVFFLDWGGVKRNRPGAAEMHGQHIAAYGAGLRLTSGRDVVFRADYGIVADRGGNQGVRDGLLTFSASTVF